VNAAIAAGITGAGTFALMAGLSGEPAAPLLRASICGGALAASALVDLRERRIPNRIVLPAAAACALLAPLAGQAQLPATAVALLLTTALLALALSKPGALGMGDIKAALLIAVALGRAAPDAILAGLALAALAGLALIARDGNAALRRSIPLAPFLTIGALLSTTLA
jgi:leader peptidase (prepilin peptidase)/N-methyltransferase